MGETEVTQAQWRAVMGSNPSYFTGCDECPVEQVSWDDIQVFLAALNSLTGQNYRLPTEAEWEYAAGGGAAGRTKWAGTDSESSLGNYAWYRDNSSNKTHPVKQKQPNALGLYDMSGNVWEWCQDWSVSYPGNPFPFDYTGSYRVYRGGSWGSGAEFCRVAYRNRSHPALRYSNLGFRLSRTP